MEVNRWSYRTRVFEKSDAFPDDLKTKYKDNANKTINIPIELKDNMKQMLI